MGSLARQESAVRKASAAPMVDFQLLRADAFADDLYNGALRDMDTNPRAANEGGSPFRNVAPEGWRRTK